MPRVRRVARTRREWPRGAVGQLMTGVFIVGGFPPGTDRETLLQAWTELKGRVYAELDARQARSRGEYLLLRPWGFWQFDSPEARDYSISEVDQLIRLGFLDDDPDDGSPGLEG